LVQIAILGGFEGEMTQKHGKRGNVAMTSACDERTKIFKYMS